MKNKVFRKYSNYSIKTCASLIIQDIIDNNQSEGWGGSFDELEALKNLLGKFNVRYTDDFFGRWEKVDPTPA